MAADLLTQARTLLRQGQLAEAERCCRQALASDPVSAEATYLLGATYHAAGHTREAEALYRRAAELDPNFADAHAQLGIALAQQGRFEPSAEAYLRALTLAPDHPDAPGNLGITLLALGRTEEAITHLERALQHRPESLTVMNSLGSALGEARRLDEAARWLRRVVAREPRHGEAWSNLAAVLTDLAQYDEALVCAERALMLNPNHVAAHKHRARLWLLAGDFGRGWLEYEWRWRGQGHGWPGHPQPVWDGSPLGGRTILLFAEQGFGDTLQFIRYAPLVRQHGGRVLVQCQRRLGRLLATCPGIDAILEEGETLPVFHVQAPMLSLPRLLGTTLMTVPAEVPYLAAAPERVEVWRPRLDRPSLKVGIAWQGNPKNRGDRPRSVPLRHFAPLMEVPGVHFYSLQKAAGSEQLAEWLGGWPVTDLGPTLDEGGAAFVDTAAVMRSLDLVITSDTSLPHLAGALGVPVWVALPQVPDWRWLLGRGDSPWYPTMRLFRQPRAGDWEAVFTRLATELRALSIGTRPS